MDKTRDTDRDILLLSVFTFMTVGLWIFFELVKTAKTTTVTTSVREIITPFNPKIDTDILTIVNNRQVY